MGQAEDSGTAVQQGVTQVDYRIIFWFCNSILIRIYPHQEFYFCTSNSTRSLAMGHTGCAVADAGECGASERRYESLMVPSANRLRDRP